MSSTYTKGTRVWLPDPTQGWIPGTVTTLTIPPDAGPSSSATLTITIDSNPEDIRTIKFLVSALETAGNDIQPTTPPPGQDALPPLRNPPLLESSEDLASLSNLNEPSGELLGRSKHVWG
jgi:myosin-5